MVNVIPQNDFHGQCTLNENTVLLDSVLRNVPASVKVQIRTGARCYNGPEEASVSRPCVLDNDQCCISQKHSKLK